MSIEASSIPFERERERERERESLIYFQLTKTNDSTWVGIDANSPQSEICQKARSFYGNAKKYRSAVTA